MRVCRQHAVPPSLRPLCLSRSVAGCAVLSAMGPSSTLPGTHRSASTASSCEMAPFIGCMAWRCAPQMHVTPLHTPPCPLSPARAKTKPHLTYLLPLCRVLPAGSWRSFTSSTKASHRAVAVAGPAAGMAAPSRTIFARVRRCQLSHPSLRCACRLPSADVARDRGNWSCQKGVRGNMST